MERTRATWTDERLDDLSRRIDRGFDRVDEDLRSLRTEMNSRFDAQHRMTLQIGAGIVTANLVAIVSVLAAG
jgi:hypothetical protein